MKTLRGKVADVKMNAVRPHPENPNQGDVGAVSLSIDENGFYGRILVQKSTGYIIAGNHRYLAAAAAGATTIPAEVLDIDDATARRILLVDNRARDLASYDESALADLLRRQLDEAGTLAGTGWTPEDLDDLLADLNHHVGDGSTKPTEPDLDLPLPAKPKTKPGQVIELGRHRLLCGDARDTAAVRAFMGGAQAEVLWTDPPYGVDYTGGTKDALTIQGDGLPGLPALLAGLFATADAVMAPGARFYIATPAGPNGAVFRQAVLAAGWRFHQTLVWVKDAFALGHSDHHYQHEDVLYGWKELEAIAERAPALDPEAVAAAVAAWAEDAKRAALEHLLLEKPDHAELHEDILYGWKAGPGRIARGGDGSRWYGDHAQTSTFFYPKPRRSAEHPTMKPVDLIRHQLSNSTRPGDVVLDLCGGSGSTLIAAEMLDLECFVVELDPRYCDVIVNRFEQYRRICDADGIAEL
jgi:DNA modification methylase